MNGGYIKHIYDIENTVLPTGKTIRYSNPNVKAFRIGQYQPDTIRVVIESKIKKMKNIFCRWKNDNKSQYPLSKENYTNTHQTKSKKT